MKTVPDNEKRKILARAIDLSKKLDVLSWAYIDTGDVSLLPVMKSGARMLQLHKELLGLHVTEDGYNVRRNRKKRSNGRFRDKNR